MERTRRTPLRGRRDRRRPWAFAISLVQRIPSDIRVRFARGCDRSVPSVETFLPGGGLQIELRLRLARDRFVESGEIALPRFTGSQGVFAHPTADRRTADIAVDDADRQIGIKLVAQLACEIVGDGTHHTTVFRRGLLPAGGILGIAVDHTGFRHIIEAQQRIGAVLELRIGIIAVAQLKFHIALASGQPDLADKHIMEFD